MYHLYIVRCADKTLYTGIAQDVNKRVTEHNTSEVGAKYTRSRRPVKLVYTRRFRSRSTASRAEARVKQLSRQEKLAMIQTAKC
ncbi:GIY-YIG nuclease family protein [Patescibacteria group bacterium]|nr:GIY-YIG nuclease family protein [Patescibacteria group bacterium]MBU0964375.1 GIY-YIG nuclease family protein [Patescibacteria group bacterium]